MINETYYTRTALLSIDKYFNDIIKSEEEIRELVKLPGLVTAIKFTSNNLLEAISNYDKNRTKQSIKTHESLINYASRAALRPTPYGKFASVGRGIFVSENKKENSVPYNLMKTKMYLNINMQWISKLISSLEKNLDIFEVLSLKISPQILFENNSVLVLNNKDANQSKIIELTPLLSYIINLMGNNSMSVQNLIKHILNKYNASREDVIRYLKKLMKEKLLFSNLQPQPPFINSLDRILNFFIKNNLTDKIIYEKLLSLNTIIIRINENNSLYQIDDIRRMMDDILSDFKGDYFHVDTKDCKDTSLLLGVKQKIDQLEQINKYFLYNDYGKFGNQKIVNYFNKYYEMNDEIPLLEFLYSENAMKELVFTGYNEEDEYLSKRINIILNWFNKNSGRSIEINDEILNTLGKYVNNTPVDYTLIVESLDECNENIIINHTLTGCRVESLMGRFAYMFDNKLRIKYDNNLYLNNHPFIEAEITTLSDKSGKINNLFTSVESSIPKITCNTVNVNNEIPLNKILVGLSNGEIYLKYKGKILLPILNNMVNLFSGFSRVEKFLMLIYISVAKPYQSLLNQFISNSNYMPRITYKGMVISKAKYRVLIDDFSKESQKNFNLFKNEFYRYMEEQGLPDHVGIEQFGDVQYLYLKNNRFLHIFYKNLKKYKVLILEELGFEYDCEKHQGYHFSQYVFSICKKNSCNYIETLDEDVLLPKDSVRMIDYSDTVYLNLYTREIYADEILINLSEMLPKILKEQDFFFIRYWDPIFHLRLRIRNCGEKKFIITEEILKAVEKLGYLDSGVIFRYTTDNFLPEINRYGGEKLYKYVEQYFIAESKLIIQLLSCKEEDIIYISIKCLLLILNELTKSDLVESKKILKSIIDNTEPIADSTQEVYKKYISDRQNKKVYEVRKNIIECRKILTQMANLEPKTVSKRKFIGSILHMFVNRIGKNSTISENQMYKLLLRIINRDTYVKLKIR